MNEVTYLAPLFGGLFILMSILVVAALISRRTRDYKHSLSDLYVSGRIRQIAGADKVNLNEEYEFFKQWDKKRRMENLTIDSAIEEELKEKLDKRDLKTK